MSLILLLSFIDPISGRKLTISCATYRYYSQRELTYQRTVMGAFVGCRVKIAHERKLSVVTIRKP